MLFDNIVPMIESKYGQYKPDLLIVIKSGKITKAAINEKASKYQLAKLIWQLYKELDRA